jgi:MFS family permease
VEIFWAAIFSAVFAFNTTYALRLGATNQMVGWLSSLPSLFAMVIMVPIARFLERRTRPSLWTLPALVLGRVGFLAAAFIPWLFPAHAAQAVIYLFVLRTIPITFFNTGFSPMLADVIPARDRARVFANRNIILSAVTAVTTLLAGQWLDRAADWTWAAFPLNYQVLYAVGGVSALASAYFVSKVKPPERQDSATKPSVKGERRERFTWSRLQRTMTSIAGERRAFLRLVVNTLLFNLGAWLVMPLYTILFVRQLNASDSWIGLNSTLANLGVIAGYAFWRRGVDRLGDHRALRLTVPLAASYAFLVALFPNLTLILVWGILINLINSGVNLSHTNVFYQVCPEERRTSYMAIYSSVMNAGAFVCPMLGVALSEVMDIRWVLLLGGVVRLLGASLFYIWRIDEVPAIELQPATT